ncbi:recombinase family protein [Ensifer aridi]|uniref:recombinase family protein n=1 Tax=Ensifer aridi TaxID=1708715 RepID=UPI000478E0A8|nr:recombinase family protein [Ensifer aridi]
MGSRRATSQRSSTRRAPGPRGAKWRDAAIRGHVSRGTGILNNTTYIGCVVWNRRQYRKNPETERRVARGNKESEWVVNDDHHALRIVDDALWARVKERQQEVGKVFSYTTTNRLNGAHRPS